VINSNWHAISYRFGVIAAYCSNFGHFAFLSPPLGVGRRLETAYDVHLRLIGKRVVDFLLGLVSIELFFASCYGWDTTSEYRFNFKTSYFAPTEVGWPKISGRMGRPQNHSSFQKTRLNDLSYGIEIWTDLSSVVSQCTRLREKQTNERTVTFLIASPRAGIPSSSEKKLVWQMKRETENLVGDT